MNRKSSYYIRVLAGGYLMYLGYSLAKATLKEHLTVIYLIFGVVFAILGLVILGTALLAMRRIDKEEREGGGERENLLLQEELSQGEDSSGQNDADETEQLSVQEEQAAEEKEEETL